MIPSTHSTSDLPSLLRSRANLTSDLQSLKSSAKFSPSIYLDRASIHASLKYPDLAIGDAYRGLLVIDEAHDESSQYHFAVVREILRPFPEKQAEWEDLQRQTEEESDEGEAGDVFLGTNGLNDHNGGKADDTVNIEAEQDRIRELAQEEVKKSSLQAYQLLVDGLEQTGCLRTALEFCGRGLKAFPDDEFLTAKVKSIPDSYCTAANSKDPEFSIQDFEPKLDLPVSGYVRREIYPWNTHEPARCGASELQSLNHRLKKVAPDCEVRAVKLPTLQSSSPIPSTSASSVSQPASTTNTQLGLFATSDLPAGSTILLEPSVITASLRLHNDLCDACTAPLPTTTPTSPSNSGPFPCPGGLCDDSSEGGVEEDVLFCSEACRDAAIASYHPAVCGNPEYDLLAKDPPDASDAADNLYFLLLARILAMAVTQSLHPLDLPEVRLLWGDFHPSSPSSTSSTLPFSFNHSILYPIHLLTHLSHSGYGSPSDHPHPHPHRPSPPWDTTILDTWVVNTLYAKIRGVASARMGRDGRPEAGAVHGLWCLANHSCAPNVRWEFGGGGGSGGGGSGGGDGDASETERERAQAGAMRMVVRTAGERVRWGSTKEEQHHQARPAQAVEHTPAQTNPVRPETGQETKDDGRYTWDGIRKGEQILNHYCDVSLPVQERREWARGALGGDCVCERCVWEAGC